MKKIYLQKFWKIKVGDLFWQTPSKTDWITNLIAKQMILASEK